MANNPPPYSNITGISRAAMKDNAQESLANYDGNARPGELVVNLEVDPPLLYVGNNLGQLTLVASGGNAGGNTDWANIGNINNSNGPFSIAIGFEAGLAPAFGTGTPFIAIGQFAGNTNQGGDATAIGNNAGKISQGQSSVAIGSQAGQDTQSFRAIAIGQGAGQTTQGEPSIAIGAFAGQNNQANNSIILNATGSALEQTTANTFTVMPVRGDSTANLVAGGFLAVYYNPTTGEFAYASS